MQSPPPRAVFMFVSLAALSILMDTASSQSLLQLAVLHRHGARTEPFVSDHGLNWDACVLSEAGVEMALSLGRFTWQQYSTFLPTNYSIQNISSISTDFERTIRTGVGFLRGMYNSTTDIPFLAHKLADVDFLLGYYYSWPSAVLGTEYIQTYNAVNNADTISYFGQSNLDIIGEQLGCPNLCRENQTLCALLGEDVSTCRLSNGGLSSNLSQLFPLMFTAQEKSNAFLYLYNHSDEYWYHTGPYGRLLAVELISYFNDTYHSYLLNGTLPTVKLHHYSAHDVTIYSFFTAIGAITMSTRDEDILVPSFASAVFLELHDTGNISVAFYECNQSFGSGYPYGLVPNVSMGCKTTPPTSELDTFGVYFAVSCPIAHFRNFVDLKKPNAEPITYNGEEKPWCYADPQDVTSSSCFSDSSDLPTEFCLQYRTICPEFSCNLTQGYILNRSDYTCVKMIDTTSPSSSHSVGWYVGIALASLALGCVIGATFRLFLHERKIKQQQGSSYSSSLLDEKVETVATAV